MTSQKRWGVWAVVSGGITGHREAWTKDDQYEPRLFDDQTTAEAYAATLRARVAHSTSPVRFSYIARLYP